MHTDATLYPKPIWNLLEKHIYIGLFFFNVDEK